MKCIDRTGNKRTGQNGKCKDRTGKIRTGNEKEGQDRKCKHRTRNVSTTMEMVEKSKTGKERGKKQELSFSYLKNTDGCHPLCPLEVAPSPVKMPSESWPQLNGDSDRYCQLCHAWFNNPGMARQHYDGKKHKKNAARADLLEQLGKTLDMGEMKGNEGLPRYWHALRNRVRCLVHCSAQAF